MANRTKGLMKVLALVLAIFLWFYVGIEQNPIVERQYNIPVTLENVPEGLEATPEQRTVNVIVRDRQDRMNTMQASNITASIDMSNGSLGQSTYPIQVKTISIFRHVRVMPREMSVTLVQVSGISLPLELDVQGEAREGVQVGQIELSSDLVLVSGQEEALAQIRQAKVAVDLSDIRETTVSSVAVRLYDAAGDELPLEKLTINPDRVLVTVPVNSELDQKTVPVYVVTVGEPANDYYLTHSTADPQEVTLIGEADVLTDIDVIETRPVDISGSEQNRRESVGLNLPAQVSVRGSTEVDVNLYFAQDPGTAIQEIQLPIELSGQAQGSAAITGPQLVQLSYRADVSPEEVAGLFQATVDVTGLGVGSHDLAISIHSESQERIPIERMNPTTVTVVIE